MRHDARSIVIALVLSLCVTASRAQQPDPFGGGRSDSEARSAAEAERADPAAVRSGG